MKLIRCYINNFGKLSSYSLDFDEKLTVIKEDNGFGKTTLCAFIKAMFYGFYQTRSKDLDENERLKFYPWQEGIFGGSLEFSCEKGNFRIERTFGKKASEDTFLLVNLDTGNESGCFSQNIGEELFGIDIKGFERCVYITSNLQNSKIPLSVSSKLSSMVDNTDDLNNYETAMSALLKRARQYSTTGNRGIIFDIKREIATMQNKIEEAKSAQNEINELENDKAELETKKQIVSKELENTRALISENTSIEVIKEKIKHYNSLVATAKETKEKFENIKNKYLGNIPDETDLNELSGIVEKIQTLSKPDDVEYLRKKRVIHSTVHSFVWIIAAILFVFGGGGLLLAAGGLIISVDIICAIALFISKKNKNKKTESELQNAIVSADEILKKFGIESENKEYSEILGEIKTDIYEYNVEKAKFDEYFEIAKKYYKRENLKSVKQDIASKTPDELKQKEKTLTMAFDEVSKEILSVNAKIEKLKQTSESYSEAVYHKDVACEKLFSAEENYKALLKGMEILKEAKENLSNKYRKKIENSFVENLKFLTDGKIGDIILSNDFDVSVIEDGFSREYSSFSVGTKAIIEIALRLSLWEALFENEKSFLIFDDPFVHLDDKILTKMAEKTKDFSEHTQIIYFSCAKSRTF